MFKKELERSASMRAVMLRYAHAFFNQVAQSAACNQFHSLEQRCCRWMLMTHDRMQSDEFLLTQEFLAMMLGVQRTGVTAAAGALQRAGLIRYKRGNVTVIDRRGLMKRSCECYGVSKKEFDRLLGDEQSARSGRAERKAITLRLMGGGHVASRTCIWNDLAEAVEADPAGGGVRYVCHCLRVVRCCRRGIGRKLVRQRDSFGWVEHTNEVLRNISAVEKAFSKPSWESAAFC